MLAANGRSAVRFQAIYVEKDPEIFPKLEGYLAENTPEGIKSFSLCGDYFDCQDEILRLCGSSFVFFFVDPKGWSPVGTARLSRLLKRPHSEFLINFMYNFLNRAVLQPDHQDNVEGLLGPLRGEREVIERLHSKAREEHLVKLYRERLKQEMGADGRYRPRAFHASILNRTKERTHYHLVYLTRHAKGIVKFVEASQETDLLQAVVRAETREAVSRQSGLFPLEDQAAAAQDGRVSLAEVKSRLMRELSSTPVSFDEARLADVLEETGWFVRDVERAFLELIRSGEVKNLDAKRLRPKHPVHFQRGDRLVRVER